MFHISPENVELSAKAVIFNIPLAKCDLHDSRLKDLLTLIYKTRFVFCSSHISEYFSVLDVYISYDLFFL